MAGRGRPYQATGHRMKIEVTEVSEPFDPAETLEELAVVIEKLQLQSIALAEGRAELELERQKYRNLLDSVPDAYLVTDLDGIVLESNTKARTLLETSRSSMLGRLWLDSSLRSPSPSPATICSRRSPPRRRQWAPIVAGETRGSIT